jgi:hypothetical protein
MRYGKDRHHKTYDWAEWVSFCEEHDIDPYENTELDIGTRDPYAPTDHYEFTGDIPKKEEGL